MWGRNKKENLLPRRRVFYFIMFEEELRRASNCCVLRKILGTDRSTEKQNTSQNIFLLFSFFLSFFSNQDSQVAAELLKCCGVRQQASLIFL